MQLIPQIYLKNGKVAIPEGKTRTILDEDLHATAKILTAAGCESIVCVDLNASPIKPSPNIALIKELQADYNLSTIISASFKTADEIEPYIKAKASLMLIGQAAYQQPELISEACKKFPAKIAVSIDVKGNRVTIPGYAAVSNKSALDYAIQFQNLGVRTFFYSQVANNGLIDDDSLDGIFNFCKSASARVICASEILNISDIERIVRTIAPKMDGIVLAKAISENRIDLRGAITLVNDLLIDLSSDATIAEM